MFLSNRPCLALSLIYFTQSNTRIFHSSVHGDLSEVKGLTTFPLVLKPLHSEIQKKVSFEFETEILLCLRIPHLLLHKLYCRVTCYFHMSQ